METERSLLLIENHQKIYARNYKIDHRCNNLEKDLADFIFSMGNDKNMINPMRVANRLTVLCGRANPFTAAVDIIRHPDDWRFKKVSKKTMLIAPASSDIITKDGILSQSVVYRA